MKIKVTSGLAALTLAWSLQVGAQAAQTSNRESEPANSAFIDWWNGKCATGNGLGFYVSDHNLKTFVNIGAFITAIINFVIFVAAVYFIIVVPYKAIQARRGQVVFGDPPPVKTCPACLSSDLPAAASKCKYCGTDQPAQAAA